MQNKKGKSVKKYHGENASETLREMGKEILSEVGTESVNAMWDQLLGNYSAEEAHHSGELAEGQELDLSKKSKTETDYSQIEAGYNYRQEILHGEKRISHETEQQISYQIQEILAELQRLVNSSQEIATQFKDVAVVQVPTGKPGKYHLNFFQFVLSAVRSARMKVEDSAAWLATFKSKKGQKTYWNMFKKHGTSFGMSNERSVATQVG